MEVSGQLHATAALSPDKNPPGTHCVRGQVGPRASLDAVEKRKISCTCREANSGRSACSVSLYRLSYPGSHDNEWGIGVKDGIGLFCCSVLVISRRKWEKPRKSSVSTVGPLANFRICFFPTMKHENSVSWCFTSRFLSYKSVWKLQTRGNFESLCVPP
jgi:hypothetical protein